jgi:hypothetical protein
VAIPFLFLRPNDPAAGVEAPHSILAEIYLEFGVITLDKRVAGVAWFIESRPGPNTKRRWRWE